jgi:WD40 repeat protein
LLNCFALGCLAVAVVGLYRAWEHWGEDGEPVWQVPVLIAAAACAGLLVADLVRVVVRQNRSGVDPDPVFAGRPRRRALAAAMGGLALAGWFATASFPPVYTGGVAASPDGAWVAVGGSDGGVRVLDPVTGKRRQTAVLGPPGCAVECLAWSPDGGRLLAGRRVAGAPPVRTVAVADLRTGAVVWERGAETGYDGRGVSWSPAGDLVAWADAAGVTVADAGTGEPRFVLPVPKGAAGVAFSPDGRHLAAGGVDSRVRVWEVGTRKEVFELTGLRTRVTCLAWSPDGGRLAAGGSAVRRPGVKSRGSGDLVLWDARTGATVAARPDSHSSHVAGVAFTRDGGRFATVSDGGTVKVWDGRTGEPVADATRACDWPGGTDAAWAADGRLAVGMDRVVVVLEPGSAAVGRRLRLRPQ